MIFVEWLKIVLFGPFFWYHHLEETKADYWKMLYNAVIWYYNTMQYKTTQYTSNALLIDKLRCVGPCVCFVEKTGIVCDTF